MHSSLKLINFERKKIMKKTLSLIIICLLTTATFSQSSAYEKFSSAKTMSMPFVDKTDMQIDKTKIELTEADWILYQFNKLEIYDSDFQYNVYGKITVNELNLLLIERRYREETNHWAVFISNDSKIISHLNIAYTNSEGFLYIESEIDKDKIIVKENNDFNDNGYSETVYTLTETGFKKE